VLPRIPREKPGKLPLRAPIQEWRKCSRRMAERQLQRGPASRKRDVLAAQNRGFDFKWLKKSSTKGSPRKAAGRPPDQKSVAASRERFAAFRFQNFQADRFQVRARSSASTSSENAGRSRAPFAGARSLGRGSHASSPAWEFLAKIGAAVASAWRTSSQSKKASGFPDRCETSWRSLFVRSLVRFHFVIAGNHFGAAVAEDGDFITACCPPFLREH